MNSLKIEYNLPYDTSGLNSGLIRWYNQLIEKSYDELDVADVCKMIRQDILKDVAIQKAIDLFFNDPYAGEYDDGGLLGVLNTLDIKQLSLPVQKALGELLKELRQDFYNFEWQNEKTEINYAKNIELMLGKLISF